MVSGRTKTKWGLEREGCSSLKRKTEILGWVLESQSTQQKHLEGLGRATPPENLPL